MNSLKFMSNNSCASLVAVPKMCGPSPLGCLPCSEISSNQYQIMENAMRFVARYFMILLVFSLKVNSLFDDFGWSIIVNVSVMNCKRQGVGNFSSVGYYSLIPLRSLSKRSSRVIVSSMQ